MERTEVLDFLQRHALIGADDPFEITPLTGGVSSDIVRIDLVDRSICLKRALPTLRVAGHWAADVRRNAHEVEWLRVAQRIVPDSVPRVLAADDVAHLFAMPYFDPAQHRVWKTELLAGRVERGFAARVMRLVAIVHGATAHDATLARRFAHDDDFADLRLNPYLDATATANPIVTEILREIRSRTANTRHALVHGDVSPKNVLMGPSGPVLLDAECAWYGDPAFDIAFCLNHLLLKCLLHAEAIPALLEEFISAVDAYAALCNFEPWRELQSRTAQLLPALMLARVDGLSPVEYLRDARLRSIVRDFAIVQLRDPVTELPELSVRWRAALGA